MDAAARSHLYDNPDATIANKVRKLLESSNSDRAKVVASYRDVVTMPGDVARGKNIELRQDGLDRERCPLRPPGGVGRIAPGTAQVAASESHEYAGQSSVCGLALNRFVDLGDLHGMQLSVVKAQLSVFLCHPVKPA